MSLKEQIYLVHIPLSSKASHTGGKHIELHHRSFLISHIKYLSIETEVNEYVQMDSQGQVLGSGWSYYPNKMKQLK